MSNEKIDYSILDDHKPKPKWKIIAGISSGVVAVIIIISLALYFALRRHTKEYKYTCRQGKCLPDQNGTSTDAVSCCPSHKQYKCNNGTCVESSNGVQGLGKCIETCKETLYICNDDRTGCKLSTTNSGYKSCPPCNSPAPAKRYKCDLVNVCTESGTGEYDSLQDCLTGTNGAKACTLNHCVDGSCTSGGCNTDGTEPCGFNKCSTSSCSANKYECASDGTCIQSTDGVYKTTGDCDTVCHTYNPASLSTGTIILPSNIDNPTDIAMSFSQSGTFTGSVIRGESVDIFSLSLSGKAKNHKYTAAVESTIDLKNSGNVLSAGQYDGVILGSDQSQSSRSLIYKSGSSWVSNEITRGFPGTTVQKSDKSGAVVSVYRTGSLPFLYTVSVQKFDTEFNISGVTRFSMGDIEIKPDYAASTSVKKDDTWLIAFASTSERKILYFEMGVDMKVKDGSMGVLKSTEHGFGGHVSLCSHLETGYGLAYLISASTTTMDMYTYDVPSHTFTAEPVSSHPFNLTNTCSIATSEATRGLFVAAYVDKSNDVIVTQIRGDNFVNPVILKSENKTTFIECVVQSLSKENSTGLDLFMVVGVSATSLEWWVVNGGAFEISLNTT
jgi:hypothetical protein